MIKAQIINARKANGRSALILAVGLLMAVASPSHAADADATAPASAAQVENPGQPNAAQTATGNQMVTPDQVNDVDRSLHENNAAQPAPVASSDAPAARSAPVVAASGEHSVWDETSLIGKIFIGFGALLTIASAARMFMA
jgi:hypothetical protein